MEKSLNEGVEPCGSCEHNLQWCAGFNRFCRVFYTHALNDGGLTSSISFEVRESLPVSHPPIVPYHPAYASSSNSSQ